MINYHLFKSNNMGLIYNKITDTRLILVRVNLNWSIYWITIGLEIKENGNESNF